MNEDYGWLLFAYAVPHEPSTVRVTLWRRLREAGALYIAPSACLLPDINAAAARLAECKRAAEKGGGTARLIPLVVTDSSVRLQLEADFSALRAAEYSEFNDQAEGLLEELRREGEKGKFTFAELEENEHELAKLQRWLKRITARDLLNCSMRPSSERLLSDCRSALATFRTATLRREIEPDIVG